MSKSFVTLIVLGGLISLAFPGCGMLTKDEAPGSSSNKVDGSLGSIKGDAGGTASGLCTDQCTEGEAKCSTDKKSASTCVLGCNGCNNWTPEVACGPHQQCNEATGKCECINACAAGATKCDSATAEADCIVDAEGCYYWDTPFTCSNGAQCATNKCNTIANQCAEGQTKCSSSKISTCVQSNGVWVWGTAQSCPQYKTCQGTTCQCNNECSDGETACPYEGATYEYKCAQDSASGCYVYTENTCPTLNKCKSGKCTYCTS